MKSPFTGGDVILLPETRKAIFRKEEYEYTHLCYQCVDTKETFTTTQMDQINTLQVYNLYRVEHKIPFPDEIKDLRRQYGLSASKMSRILGFGDNQYRLYENGEIPSIANRRVLKAIQQPEVFKTFLEAAKDAVSADEFTAIIRRLDEYRNTAYERGFLYNLIYGGVGRNKYNGYAMLSVSKLKNVMLYFIEKFGGVFVTQMNKLLFYTDFLAYKENGQAITGLSFKAIKHGPVPNRWDRVYGLIEDVYQIEVESKNGNIGNKLMSDISFDKTSLSDEQLTVLDRVYETFRNDTPTSISKKSHDEIAWIHNIDNQSLIDFKYAFFIKAL